MGGQGGLGSEGKRDRKEETEKHREFFQSSQPCGSLSGGADLQQDLQIVGSAELHSLVETYTHQTFTNKHTHTHTHTHTHHHSILDRNT